MKLFGLVLVIVGLAAILLTLNMNTAVAVHLPGILGSDPSDINVQNVGLMDRRRNYLLVSSVISLIGAIFLVAGYLRGKGDEGVTYRSGRAAQVGRRSKADEVATVVFWVAVTLFAGFLIFKFFIRGS